jgi:hypothetical protein
VCVCIRRDPEGEGGQCVFVRSGRLIVASLACQSLLLLASIRQRSYCLLAKPPRRV